jgi:hypothetical protein
VTLCKCCYLLVSFLTLLESWEEYVPIKGDTFTKVIQFLQNLGIVGKCKEQGWNDISDRILQTLRGPFRSLIPFQFQPGHQIEWVPNSSDADIQGPDQSMLDHERIEEVHDMDIDNPQSGRTFDSRTLPRLAANRIIKTKRPGAARGRRKNGTPSARRQLQSFARGLADQQMPHLEKSFLGQGKDPESRPPPGQWHFATKYQDHQMFINNGARHPLNDISLNLKPVYPSGTDSVRSMQGGDSSPISHPRFTSPLSIQVRVDQQRTGESISDTLRLERTGISTINALLNHDNNASATTFASTQDSLQDAEDGCTEPVFSVAGTENFRFQ